MFRAQVQDGFESRLLHVLEGIVGRLARGRDVVAQAVVRDPNVPRQGVGVLSENRNGQPEDGDCKNRPSHYILPRNACAFL